MAAMPEKPFPQCYWVVPGALLAGEYPRHYVQDHSARKIKSLEDAGIGAFIDLTEVDELFPYADLLQSASHQRFPIRDLSVPPSPAQTIATLDAIDGAIESGRTAYVHCWGGIGRTGVIMGCWLARHGEPGPAALARLQELWMHCSKWPSHESPQTRAQRDYVLNWNEPT